MLVEFALHYEQKTGKIFKVAKKHIWYALNFILIQVTVYILVYYLSCLAHIINPATQQLISTKSKAKYYSVHEDYELDADIADPEQPNRDEVGLVRAIFVKVWCSFNLTLYYFRIKLKFLLRLVPPLRGKNCLRRYKLGKVYHCRSNSCWT